jgi:hypothetical protein
MDKILSNIIGNWKVSALTPFGISSSNVNIKSIEPFVSGTIVGERGSLDFDNGIVSGDKITFSATVDTPIKATFTVNVQVVDDKFEGTLEIDQYVKLDIKGQKNVNL